MHISAIKYVNSFKTALKQSLKICNYNTVDLDKLSTSGGSVLVLFDHRPRIVCPELFSLRIVPPRIVTPRIAPPRFVRPELSRPKLS